MRSNVEIDLSLFSSGYSFLDRIEVAEIMHAVVDSYSRGPFISVRSPNNPWVARGIIRSMLCGAMNVFRDRSYLKVFSATVEFIFIAMIDVLSNYRLFDFMMKKNCFMTGIAICIPPTVRDPSSSAHFWNVNRIYYGLLSLCEFYRRGAISIIDDRRFDLRPCSALLHAFAQELVPNDSYKISWCEGSAK